MDINVFCTLTLCNSRPWICDKLADVVSARWISSFSSSPEKVHELTLTLDNSAHVRREYLVCLFVCLIVCLSVLIQGSLLSPYQFCFTSPRWFWNPRDESALSPPLWKKYMSWPWLWITVHMLGVCSNQGLTTESTETYPRWFWNSLRPGNCWCCSREINQLFLLLSGKSTGADLDYG